VARRYKIIAVVLCVLLLFTGCDMLKTMSNEDKQWKMYEDSAQGSTVRLYAWDGDEAANKWFDTVLALKLKETYGITLKRIPATYDTIFEMLKGNKDLKQDVGDIDLLWISGWNFEYAKKHDYLFGPFSDKLPNVVKYLNSKEPEVASDRGFPTQGYSVPFGHKQLALFINEDAIFDPPQDLQGLLDTARNHPGKFTYPVPEDPAGMAFLETIIYGEVGYKTIANTNPNKAAVEAAIAPAIGYLKQMAPYLYEAGRTYPSSEAELDPMFQDGRLLMTMSMDHNHATKMLDSDKFPQGVRPFFPNNGTAGTAHYFAIPYNSANKSGAMVAINLCLTPEMQADKFMSNGWGDIPVLSVPNLSADELKLLKKSVLKKTSPKLEDLVQHRQPQLSVALEGLIKEIWHEQIHR